MVNTKEINGTENNINEIINKITKLIQCEDDNNKFMDGLKIIEEELKKSECKTIKDNKIITKVAIELVSMNIENYDDLYKIFKKLNYHWYDLCEDWIKRIPRNIIEKNLDNIKK